MARELTSGLACPPPPPQLISRSNTQTQIAMDSEEDEVGVLALCILAGCCSHGLLLHTPLRTF
eukprot:1149562-Pelagomonas_calceolata.AAC.7